MARAAETALNAICPYFTMFPLDFPLKVLRAGEGRPKWVLDPFCGRGTTNFACRLLGVRSLGMDSSPVAVAIASAKLCPAKPPAVIRAVSRILDTIQPRNIPEGEFWRRAFHRDTLSDICRIREALLADCRSNARVMLRALMLGALHGPSTKGLPSYFSNQSPRTFAPKPRYAVNYWKREGLRPKRVRVPELVARKAEHYLSHPVTGPPGIIRWADSRDPSAFRDSPTFDMVITSPPYYGMRTYLPDQWLRSWFLGGPAYVDYDQPHSQLSHNDPDSFADQLRRVWQNVASKCRSGARLIYRFGGINDRSNDPIDIAKASLRDTPWRLTTIRPAGTAAHGKRQAHQFGNKSKPREEYDLYARLT